MIRGFQRAQLLEPQNQHHLQWGPAFGAGLIAGFILLIVPRGSPWSALTFFSPAIMGRAGGLVAMPLVVVWLLHLGVAVIYGLIISRVVSALTQIRAVLTGGLVGLLLYLINLGVVSFWWPEVRGNEVSVLFTHVVFGLIAAAVYRGLLKRQARLPEQPTPGQGIGQ